MNQMREEDSLNPEALKLTANDSADENTGQNSIPIEISNIWEGSHTVCNTGQAFPKRSCTIDVYICRRNLFDKLGKAQRWHRGGLFNVV